MEEIFYNKGGETLEQVSQRSCGCLIPGSVQRQVEQGFEQPGLVEGVPAHGRGVGTRCSLKIPSPKPFYDSLKDLGHRLDNSISSFAMEHSTSLTR